MAKDKLFSTSNKQRRTPPAQVLKTTNRGHSAVQTTHDPEPFEQRAKQGIPKRPSMTPTTTVRTDFPAKRPKTIALHPSVGRWQRKGTKPSPFSGVYERLLRARRSGRE